MYMFRCR